MADTSPSPSSTPAGLHAIVALAAGLGLGLAAARWPGPWTIIIDLLEPLGVAWLSALQMLALPLMAALLTLAINRVSGTGTTRLAGIAVLWFCCVLAVAALLTVWLGRLTLEWFPVEADAREAFRNAAANLPAARSDSAPASARDFFLNLVPTNLVRSAASGDYLALVVATALFGTALRFAPEPARSTILSLAQAVADWCIALATLLFRVLPAAVFVLTLVAGARGGASIATGLIYYIAWVSAFVFGGLLALYPMAAWLGRTSVRRFARPSGPRNCWRARRVHPSRVSRACSTRPERA